MRAAAAEALAALSRDARTVTVEPARGDHVEAGLRARLRSALADELARLGYVVGEEPGPFAFRLTPSLLLVDATRGEDGSRVEVRASVVATDVAGQVAAMVEGGARASAPSASAPAGPLWAQAIDAAARDLAEDLARRLREHAPAREAQP